MGNQYGFSDGLFSGFDPEKRKYDKSAWAFASGEQGVPRRDLNFKHPRCVFSLMKKHYARYTLDKVSAVTGTSVEDLIRVYKAFAATGSPDKTGTIMYAMGWTQHTVGVQNIRLMAMIQLVLGNIGRPGGGINALRGESNVQGSTDHCLLFPHLARLPGHSPGLFGHPGRIQQEEHARDPRSLVGQLVAKQAQVYSQLSKGHVRRQCHQGQTSLDTAGCPRSTTE